MTSVERLGSERGAVFVQVGIALFVLVAFNVFVLDYGVCGQRVARRRTRLTRALWPAPRRAATTISTIRRTPVASCRRLPAT